jgi:hypothetical protein
MRNSGKFVYVVTPYSNFNIRLKTRYSRIEVKQRQEIPYNVFKLFFFEIQIGHYAFAISPFIIHLLAFYQIEREREREERVSEHLSFLIPIFANL